MTYRQRSRRSRYSDSTAVRFSFFLRTRGYEISHTILTNTVKDSVFGSRDTTEHRDVEIYCTHNAEMSNAISDSTVQCTL